MQNQPEILVISHKFPPSIGGMQKHCYELVLGLEERCTVHRLIQTAGVSKLLFFLTVVRKARRILKVNPQINLIYVNDGLMAFVLTRLLKYTFVPMVATIHGLDVVFPMKFYQRWVRNHLSKYQAILAVSEATKQECVSRGIDKSKVFMVKNGYKLKGADKARDLSSIHERLKSTYVFDPHGKRLIISIGRGVKRKGFSWFIENVMTSMPEEVCYLIIGPGANTSQIRWLKALLPKAIFDKLVLFAGLAVDELRMKEVVEKYGLEDRVRRISGLSNDEVEDLVRLADLSVMPNIKVEGDYEGFGLVALEATSKGTLCVASGIEGITTAVEDGVNGVLLEPGNKSAWVSKINELLNDPEKTKKLARKFQENTFEHSHSWEQMVAEYYDIFTRITKQTELK